MHYLQIRRRPVLRKRIELRERQYSRRMILHESHEEKEIRSNTLGITVATAGKNHDGSASSNSSCPTKSF